MTDNVQAIREYLTSQEWPDTVGVIQLGEEYYFTLRAEDWTSIKAAAYSLAGTLTAYGDFNITDQTSMVNPTNGEIVTITLTATQN